MIGCQLQHGLRAVQQQAQPHRVVVQQHALLSAVLNMLAREQASR